jgi:hypothetical protein
MRRPRRIEDRYPFDHSLALAGFYVLHLKNRGISPHVIAVLVQSHYPKAAQLLKRLESAAIEPGNDAENDAGEECRGAAEPLEAGGAHHG